MPVAPHRLRHHLDAEHVLVGGDVEQARLVLQAAEHAVEEGEPLRVAVAGDEFGEVDEAARHAQRRASARRTAASGGDTKRSGASAATRQTTASGGTLASASARAASRQPS